ncbi:MAG: hypothetical protein AB9880_11085 [Christensenellales bacterium]
MKTSIKRLDGFDIPLPEGGLAKGVDQSWYATHWQRLAGCGPSTASNILRYYRDRLSLPLPAGTKREAQGLMAWVWQFVTPGLMGLNTTERYLEGVKKLQGVLRESLPGRALDIPADAARRPGEAEVASFLREALAADCPVAFLNLSRGALDNLEDWHWVTLISLSEDEAGLQALAVDNGRLLTLDIGRWLSTTTKGGGFAVWG